MDIKASLTKKIGPLPAWVWALMVAILLYLLYHHYKSKSAATAASAGNPAVAQDPSATGVDSGSGGSVGGGGSFGGDPGIGTGVGDQVSTSPVDFGPVVAPDIPSASPIQSPIGDTSILDATNAAAKAWSDAHPQTGTGDPTLKKALASTKLPISAKTLPTNLATKPTAKKGFTWGGQFITTKAQLIAFERAHGNTGFNINTWIKNHPAAAGQAGW